MFYVYRELLKLIVILDFKINCDKVTWRTRKSFVSQSKYLKAERLFALLQTVI